MQKKIRIGSRGSDLALWQANYTTKLLSNLGLEVELIIIQTQGDKIQHLSFDKMEGKGFFTKEIEQALLNNEIDLAVHSHKDLPTENPKGLKIGAVSYREECSDTLLIRPEKYNSKLALHLEHGAIVGTSSFRRKAQLASIRSDIHLNDLRGNVPTRIKKLADGQYDAIMLATAGLNRLNLDLSAFNLLALDPTQFVPAPAQGVLAWQIREDDVEMEQVLKQIHHDDVQQVIMAERLVLNQLDGGCLLPLGAYAEKRVDLLGLWCAFMPNDSPSLRKIFLWGSEPVSLARKAVSALTNNVKKTVFISRDSSDAKTFIKLIESNGHRVFAESPLVFEEIEIQHLPMCDWLFFASPRCVKYFFEQDILAPAGVSFAALGSGTATALKEYGIEPQFIGSDHSDTAETGNAFLQIARGTNVCFPGAEKSLESIQHVIANHTKVFNLPVYRTLTKELNSIPVADIYVFTSPSCVDALANSTEIHRDVHVVAIGNSTSACLQKHGFTNITTAPFTSLPSLAETVLGLV
jgi:hydroxymethylbilane synthase